MPRETSTDTLLAAGLESAEASRLCEIMNGLPVEFSDEQRWSALTQRGLTPGMPFAVHELLFHAVYANRTGSDCPPPAWIPDEQTIKRANVTQLGRTLGLSNYEELRTWAAENRGEFWEAACQAMGIRFQVPYQEVLSVAQGVEHADWFVGGQLNITESCFSAAPDHLAIVSQTEGCAVKRTTYRELEILVNRVAGGLRKAGFVAGDRIGVMTSMTPESIAAYIGLIRAGCVPVAIAESFAPREIEVRLRISEAKAIFLYDVIVHGGRLLPSYEKLAEVDREVTAIVISRNEKPMVSLGKECLRWDEFLSSDEHFDAVPAPPDAELNLLFSSGTTGEPKAIPWLQTTPIKCGADGRFHQDIHSDSIVAWPTSLGWMMGPWLIYASLLNRATMAVYDGDPTSREYCKFVQDAGVTVLGVVPSLVRAWRQRNAIEGLDWTNIEVFSSTGECSNAEDMLFLMSRAGYRPIIEYCGGTEVGGGYITGTVVQAASPGCFTTPALGLDFCILNGDEPSDRGEVYLIPPSIGFSQRLLNADHHATYYANTPALESCPGLRRHGDEIARLPGGYYHACGRTDDTMNLGGIKVSAVELERCLNALPGVHETAAIAVSKERGGPSELCVFAVVREELSGVAEDALRKTMQDRIKEQLNPLFRIGRVLVIDKLPRTASNKIVRRTLRDSIENNNQSS